MKKLYFLLIAVLTLLQTVCAQSMEQGANIINPNVRLGFFNVTENDKGNDSLSHAKARHLEFIFAYDRGIDDDFTVGGAFRYNSFLLAKDTVANEINQAYGLDFCFDAAFHFIKSQHVDLYFAATMGVSYLKLVNTNLNDQTIYTAWGATYNIDFGARFYLGAHLGISLTGGYSGYDYPNGTEIGIQGYVDHMGFVFGGGTCGLGICYKL